MKQKLHQQKEIFLKHLDGMLGYSPLTVISYNESIEQMLNKADIWEEEGVIRINLTPLRLFIAPLKPKTISTKLSAVRSFVKYLRSNDWVIELRGDEAIKIPKTLPKPISHEHILCALEHAKPFEKLIISFLYSMGLRISELANLKLCDVNEQWCRVLGKGKKERDVPMLKEVYAQFKAMQFPTPSYEYVFEEKGEKLSEHSLRYSLTKAFSEVGLKATPHQLRHSYATELLNHGARIADVSELLGHASMATTQIYTKLGNAIKMEHYLSSHPLCNKTEES